MISSRRRRRPGATRAPVVLLVVVLLVAVGGGLWYWFGRDDRVSMFISDEEMAEETRERPDVPPLDLPELDASDAFVRGLVSRLSAHPQLASWLVTEGLIERFVLVVVDLAGNSNPAANLRFMAPGTPFSTRQEGGRTVISPASQRRYDLMTTVFSSLDTEGTVQLYWQLRPLIDEAYRRLGIPDQDFDDVLALALENIREARVPSGPVEVLGVDPVHVFVDEELEARRGLEKSFIRMGPENARRVQEKALEFEEVLGLWP